MADHRGGEKGLCVLSLNGGGVKEQIATRRLRQPFKSKWRRKKEGVGVPTAAAHGGEGVQLMHG
jgi:hypothetical protein